MSGLASEVKELLQRLGIAANKRLGQNFMIDEASLSSIAGALKLHGQDTVLEIGPGLGFLTRELLGGAGKVIAVEKDRVLASYLRDRYSALPLEVIEQDILKLDFASRLGPVTTLKVAGNIPYSISSPIVEWLIERRSVVSAAVLTVQKEFGQRLAAVPGNKTWGALSVFAQFYARVRLIRTVGRAHFWPSPNVDSVVVLLDFTQGPAVRVEDEQHFFKLVRRAFQKRRKTILNALTLESSPSSSRSWLESALRQARIDPRRRPETLSLTDWAELSAHVLK